MARGFLERSASSLRNIAQRALFSESVAREDGVLQRVDPRAKTIVVLSLIVACVATHDLRIALLLLATALLIAALVPRAGQLLLRRAWLVALAMTGAAALPAVVLTPGDVVARLPFDAEVTRQGLTSVAFLLARVLTATTLSLVLVLTTRWSAFLRSLRMLGVPAILIAIIEMTYRYIFVVLEMAGELFDGRRSRRVGPLGAAAERRLAGATAGALMTRTLRLTEDVYLAMQSRGFRGEVRVLRDPRMHASDWLILSAGVLASAALVAVGR